jgi:hypothetical protein
MTRFYQNLLGRRAGLLQPLPKAVALDEAKRWLRELTADEAGTELAALDRGTVRPLAKADGPAPRAAASSPQPSGVRPYAHPYYWAAFILIGDPIERDPRPDRAPRLWHHCRLASSRAWIDCSGPEERLVPGVEWLAELGKPLTEEPNDETRRAR